MLIPIQCEYYALEGLSQLLSNIQLIERHLNPKLAVSTILLTMYDGRTNLAHQVVDDVREHFPEQVLNTLIPRSVRISEAPSYGQSVISYDTDSPGSLSYSRRPPRSPDEEHRMMAATEAHRTRPRHRRPHPRRDDGADRPVDVFFPARGERRPDEPASPCRARGSPTSPPTTSCPNAAAAATRVRRGRLAELVTSIREIGVLQPIVVRPRAGAARASRSTSSIMGERRLRATKQPGSRRSPRSSRTPPTRRCCATRCSRTCTARS